jgi:hypothetical protein
MKGDFKDKLLYKISTTPSFPKRGTFETMTEYDKAKQDYGKLDP